MSWVTDLLPQKTSTFLNMHRLNNLNHSIWSAPRTVPGGNEYLIREMLADACTLRWKFNVGIVYK